MMNESLTGIPPLDLTAMDAARHRQALLTKPAGALGRLEALSIQLAGMRGDPMPQIARPIVVVAAADHGVAAEGVSAYPQEITAQMVGNFLRGGAAINVLAQLAGAEVMVVDAGVAADLAPHSQLHVRKIAPGTANLRHGPAMPITHAVRSVSLGQATAASLAAQGYDLIALGEMGIANTTAAALLTAAITGAGAEATTGRGTGLNDAQLAHKRQVVMEALQRHDAYALRGMPLLAAVGGYEIAFLAGCALGAASWRVPVLLDGYISTAAALVAAKLDPAVREYFIASHRSGEPGHNLALQWLALEPLLDLGLRLGEGSGAALAIPIVRAAAATLRLMATFDDLS